MSYTVEVSNVTGKNRNFPLRRLDAKGNGYTQDFKIPAYALNHKLNFASEDEKAIETVIDNSYDQENLASYIKSQISKDMDADYIFTIQLSKSQNILRDFDIPLRTWSYPNSIIVGSTITSNYTHINIDFKANFNSVTK